MYSPVIQGNARMMAPPAHAQPGLVSSSAAQFGAHEQTHAMYGRNHFIVFSVCMTIVVLKHCEDTLFKNSLREGESYGGVTVLATSGGGQTKVQDHLSQGVRDKSGQHGDLRKQEEEKQPDSVTVSVESLKTNLCLTYLQFISTLYLDFLCLDTFLLSQMI